MIAGSFRAHQGRLGTSKGKGQVEHPYLQRGEHIPGSGAPGNVNQARSEKADDFAQQIAWIIKEMGGGSLREIADDLNNVGYRTRRCKEWQATGVNLVLERVELC